MRYASIDQFAGDIAGDVLFGTAGIVLLVLSLLLYYRMTRNH